MNPIERYLGHLDDGDFTAAAGVFTADAIYVRPRFQAGVDGGSPTFGELVLVSGRDAILESFRKRGKQPYRHVVLASATSGGRCFVEMTLSGYGSNLESIAVADLDGDHIKRYIAVVAPVGAGVASRLFPSGASS